EHDLDERPLDGADERGVQLTHRDAGIVLEELGQAMAHGFLERQYLGGALSRLAGERKVFGHQRAAPREHRGAQEGVLELAYVTGPGVAHEELANVVAHADDRRPQVAVELVDEELDQVRDVAAPLAERREG